jgi:hypothetical protein
MKHELIAIGDKGPEVEHVQKSLGLPADGDFGPATEQGVRSFQGACGLMQDGVVGADTWKRIDMLDRRVKEGSDALSGELRRSIDALVAQSGVVDIQWEDRGRGPLGYYQGMAKTFAFACQRYALRSPDAMIMAQAAGDSDDDALAYYSEQFADLDMENHRAGLDTLRHLFTLMVGLGMRESSGDFWEGRDMSADNTDADTCEAGLFQTSYNISSCSDTIAELLAEFWDNPHGFRASFAVENGSPSASQLDCYGSGTGAQYQWLARYAPAFTAFVTGVGLRLRRSHWGPIGRYEVEILPAIDDLLRKVQELMLQDRR